MHAAAFCPRCGAALAERVPSDDSRVRKVCTRCAYVVYVNPKIAAGTIPLRDGRIAMIRRGIEPSIGLWSWPCGYVEIDETIEEGARRETREESGLVVTLGPMLGAYSYPVRAGDAPGPTNGIIVASWATAGVEGELVAGDDAADAAWFDPFALDWDTLAFDSTRRALRDLLARLRG